MAKLYSDCGGDKDCEVVEEKFIAQYINLCILEIKFAHRP